MAAIAENQESRRMNLCALKQRDPYITGIVDTASQVALYLFNSKTSEWEKTDIEGTLFVYSRLDHPSNGFMILNRLGLNDLVEPINRSLEFQLQDPFLLYRNDKGGIYGVWFYDQDECARIGQLMNSLVQVATSRVDISEPSGEQRDSLGYRQRRASESDSQQERTVAAKVVLPSSQQQSVGVGGTAAMQGTQQASSGAGGNMNVDILQILCRAQDEYDKTKFGGKRCEPKPMTDNPNAAAMKTSSLPKPLAVKMRPDSQGDAPMSADSTSVHTQISLDALFRRARQNHEATRSSQIPADQHMPAPLLHRLMSSPAQLSLLGSAIPITEPPPPLGGGHHHHHHHHHHAMPLHIGPVTVGDKLSETERDLMPKPAGAESPGGCANGSVICQQQLQAQQRLPYAVTDTEASTVSQSPSNTDALLADVSLLSPSKLACRVAGDTVVPTDRVHQQYGAGMVAVTKPKTPILIAPVVDSKPVLSTACTLMTPQQLSQSSKTISSQLSNASVLLSPMVFQAATKKHNASSSSPTTNLFYQNRASASTGQILDIKPPMPPTQPSSSYRQAPTAVTSSQSSQQSCQRLPSVTSQCQPQGDATTPPVVNTLTRRQMQQAIVYLIQNDPNFVSTLHDAYLRSVQAEKTTASRSHDKS